uniref:Uncharacterized protein n=1 Tax=Arundo donax TaxID=35708 RepID=A0A0A9F254_ARUDO
MHPDFALQETHLSCPGHQQPKRMTVMLLFMKKLQYFLPCNPQMPRTITLN